MRELDAQLLDGDRAEIDGLEARGASGCEGRGQELRGAVSVHVDKDEFCRQVQRCFLDSGLNVFGALPIYRGRTLAQHTWTLDDDD